MSAIQPGWTVEGTLSKYKTPIIAVLSFLGGAGTIHYLPQIYNGYNTRKNQETAFYVWQFNEMAKAGHMPQLPSGMVSTGLPFIHQASQQPALDVEKVYKGLEKIIANQESLDKRLTDVESAVGKKNGEGKK